jgi:hypothetical protein
VGRQNRNTLEAVTGQEASPLHAASCRGSFGGQFAAEGADRSGEVGLIVVDAGNAPLEIGDPGQLPEPVVDRPHDLLSCSRRRRTRQSGVGAPLGPGRLPFRPGLGRVSEFALGDGERTLGPPPVLSRGSLAMS